MTDQEAQQVLDRFRARRWANRSATEDEQVESEVAAWED